jgi:membrane-associated phospholipid phosphatase
MNIVATEILSAGYFSYYFLIPGLGLFLFFGRRDREMRRFITATCVTFFISYLVFILYPVSGPRFHFAGQYENEITGIIFRPLAMLVIDNAAFRGGAMPSSHMAEAIIVMLFAIRSYGRRAYFLIPVVLALALGTVYGRFHFATDVIIGIILGIIVYFFTLKFYPAKKDFAREWQPSNNRKRSYVSDSV